MEKDNLYLFCENMLLRSIQEYNNREEVKYNQIIYNEFCLKLSKIFSNYFSKITVDNQTSRNLKKASEHWCDQTILTADYLSNKSSLYFNISRIFQNGKMKFVPSYKSEYSTGAGFIDSHTKYVLAGLKREYGNYELYVHDYDLYTGKTLEFIKDYLDKNFDISNINFVVDVKAGPKDEILDCRDFFFLKTNFSGFLCADKECGFETAPYEREVKKNIEGVKFTRRSYLDEDIFENRVSINMRYYKDIKRQIYQINDEAKKQWIFRKEDKNEDWLLF